MKTLFRKLLTLTLVLAVSVVFLGCALTQGVARKAEGRYKVVKDDSPDGFHMGPEPEPAYYPLLIITVPVDIATFPIQLPFIGCIIIYYDWNM